MITNFHAKYYAHDLTRRAASGLDRLSMSLFDAAADLNPHQIEAALFALQSPLCKGVILADEVGLGKTIQAGIVLCQCWAERKRRMLVISPASIRKQWALELGEKFNLPSVVLDARGYRETLKAGRSPLNEKAVIVISFNFANKIREELKAIAWDIVVIDEALKLRNAYRASNKVGQGIRWATEDCRKLLLTATPLQNSLLELYGLSSLLDEHLFGDVNSFRSQYTGAGSNLEALRQRLSTFGKRTLRNQVTEYIRYTERRPLTRPFRPTDDEHALYEAVSAFLQRENSYALPQRQRHLTALILRKLLASSSEAIAATLDTLKERLENLRDQQAASDPEFAENLFEGEEIEDDLLDEILAEDEEGEKPEEPVVIDRPKLKEEIAALEQLSRWAHSIGIDTKTRTLLSALEIGFEKMGEIGGKQKALIFTESRRTQDYIKSFLESHGYQGKVVLFNGTNGGPEATAIYERWAQSNQNVGRSTGSLAVDVRTALIEHFRDEGTILIATEAAAEGINLQFCSLVINYDLPWNPQRIEQRIGRCHRYGQKHDVVVINFLNERNAADQRVLELLSEKFKLFSGVFGASDEVLGTIESGVDFEKRVLGIYQQCRTLEEIDAAFKQLQQEMDEQIRTRLDDTRRSLLEHFDERYYTYRKREWELPHLEYRELSPNDPNLLGVGKDPNDNYYRILIDRSQEEIVAKLEELKGLIECQELKSWEFRSMKAIWFGQHLYQPLLHMQDKIVEISPVPLNRGERTFVEDLKAFHDNDGGFFEGKELYLLRNLSKGKGVGFFEAGNFHPDFILWLLVEGKQHVIFVYPKGIRNVGVTDPKIHFYETIKEIEELLGDPNVHLHSFIVSGTPSHTMRLLWGVTKPTMTARHIMFQEEDKDSYVCAMLTRELDTAPAGTTS